MNQSPLVLGLFETVAFPDYQIKDVKAKIDTGAYTGALHCTKIREEDGVLYFSPFDHPEVEIQVKDFLVRHVKSSNGSQENRYFIETNIELHGKIYPIVLSLADRSEMKWPLLIGRRFLRKNRFLVDVSKQAKVS